MYRALPRRRGRAMTLGLAGGTRAAAGGAGGRPTARGGGVAWGPDRGGGGRRLAGAAAADEVDVPADADVVVARAAIHHAGARIGVGELIVAGPADEPIGSRPAEQGVGPRLAPPRVAP